VDVVNMHEAKTHLSRLVQRAAAGEEIVIGRAGHPLAKLVPYRPPTKKRREGGFLKGQIVIHDDFDDPLPEEIMRYFRGEDDEDEPPP
jgi:prevent-host-death family protein